MEFGLIVLGSLLFIGFVFYLEHICTKANERMYDLAVDRDALRHPQHPDHV